MRILVVEDDSQTATLVGRALLDDGHSVDVVIDGNEGLKLAAVNTYDVLVVDRMLPGLDGLSIVRRLRTADVKSSVIFLTSLGAIEDRIEGLEAGGDDYLVKPFALVELVARVNALGRRPALIQENILLKVADLEMHLIRREVKRRGEIIYLQPREFMMLEILMRNKGRVITRTMLLREVWDLQFDPKTTIVQTNVSRLRDKIDRPGDVPLIQTVRRVGYRIDEPH
jgi:two-component system OmpR family response regulator